MKKIGIACDHAGYDMKEFLVGYLSAKGYEVIDFGTHSEESVDYPDFAHALATSVETGETEQGIGLCGSGEGMAMTSIRVFAQVSAGRPRSPNSPACTTTPTCWCCPRVSSTPTRPWR